MATEKLQIVIDTVYRGRTDAKRAESDLKDVGNEAKRSKEKFDDLGVALGVITTGLAAAATAAKLTYDEFKRGAELEAARGRFDNLATSIGSVGDALLGDMREATRGLVADADLVASAGEIMSLGLADTHDSVVRLSSVAGTLGWDMQQLTLTLANQSTMRLDALGLSVEDVTDKFDNFKAAGLGADEAFQLAVIEAGEEKIGILGETADTTAGQLQILETRGLNIRNAFSQAVAEGLEPTLDVLLRLNALTGGSEPILDSVIGSFGEGLADGSGIGVATDFLNLVATMGEMNQRGELFTLENFFTLGLTGNLAEIINSRDLLESAGKNAERLASGEQMLSELARVYRMDYTVAIGDSTEALYEASDAAEERTSYAEDEAYAIRQVYAEMEEDRRIRERHAEILDLQRERSLRLRDALDRADAATGDLFTSQIEFVENADPLAVELYNQADAAGASAEELTLLGVATGLFTEEQAEAALKAAALRTKIQELGEKIAEGMGIEEALAELDLFRQALDNNIRDRSMTITVYLDDRTGGMVYQQGGTGPGVSEYATGTSYHHGGDAIVGEFGPERVSLPAGSRVTSTNVTHNDNRRMTLTNSRGVQRVVSNYLRNRSRRSRAV